MVTAIHIAPASRLPMRAVESVQVEAGLGIVGDRYHGTKHRHVTVQSQTALDAATEDLGSPVEPGGTRRNITISHGDVPTTPRRRGGPVEWSSGYASAGWCWVVQAWANSLGVRSPWALWGRCCCSRCASPR